MQWRVLVLPGGPSRSARASSDTETWAGLTSQSRGFPSHGHSEELRQRDAPASRLGFQKRQVVCFRGQCRPANRHGV